VVKAAWIAAGLLMSLLGFAEGGTRDPATPDSKHLEYGSKFHCVVRLVAKKGGSPQMASAVAINSQYAITAAHAVAGCDSGEILTDTGSRLPVRGFSIHPDYESNSIGTRDVAVVEIDGDFGLEFYPPIYANQDEIGKVVSICGYGVAGTFDTGGIDSDQQKRAGSNIVDGVIRGMLTCSVGTGTRTTLEFLITPGDSGGGMFIGNELCGINSMVMHSPGRTYLGKRGDESGHTRLSDPEVRDWILRSIAPK